MTYDFLAAYRRLVNPGSIVVVGASNNPGKPGGGITKNIIEKNYAGKLYLVNKSGEEVRGVPAHTSIADLPDNIDLGIIVIPAGGVYQAMEELGDKNCKTVVILTAGFGEADEKGKAEENRLVTLAEQKGMVMIGPNCVGVITPNYCGKFAGINPELRRGSIDVVSASGATVDYLMEQAELRGLKFDNVFTLGNSAHWGVEDVVELLDRNHTSENAPIKLIYIEGIKKPGKLLNHARSLTEKGCILVGIKSGVSDDGKRAAASHTGAMATSDTAVQALFDKAGIIRVRSKFELVDIGCALNALRYKTDLKNLCIITDAGGPGVMLTDEVNKYGLSIPKFKETTQKKLAEVLVKYATVTNPIDCLPVQTGKHIADAIQVIEQEKEAIDAVVVITGNSMLSDKWESYSAIAECMDTGNIPVIPVLSSITTAKPLIDSFEQANRTIFVDEVRAGKALGRIATRPKLFDADTVLENYDRGRLETILGDQSGVLSAGMCTELLDAAGLKRPRQAIVGQLDQLAAGSNTLRFPVVAKIIGPLHKSDVGGVIVGIETLDELEAAWKQLSRIEGFEGVLLQEMAVGNEVIIGVKKEEGYGHLVMFGLGGIFTEVFKDSRFALAPLGQAECEQMIRGIRSIKMLEGVRNQKGMDVVTLADQLARISRLVSDFPQISEIDLNPVKGEGKRLLVVDCRIII